MPATINAYNKIGEYIGDNTIDLDQPLGAGTGEFPVALMTSVHVFTATNTLFADVSVNQIATGNGYTRATGGGTGQLLQSVTWVESAGTVTWDAADVSWTAAGGSIAADDAVIFADDSAGIVDALMFSIDFGGTQTATDGGTFNINWNAAGIFTIP